jgi:L-ascorbate metabolism protein UlaG (beta-lactamase superfamily)
MIAFNYYLVNYASAAAKICYYHYMTIKKIGHCCLYIEVGGVRILTDPGVYSTAQNDIVGVDFLVITHEHADHYHVDSVKAILKNNPKIVIITNSAVGALLKKENIEHQVVGDKQHFDMNGVSLAGWGTKHAVIYKDIGACENTGYLINSTFFYPGDAFTLPGAPVDILALPVAGPWMKLSEAIEYVLAVKPKKAFPVHDAIMKTPGSMNPMFQKLLEPDGINFVSLNPGETATF